MKRLLLGLTILATIISCSKDSSRAYLTATVVRNCTGTYLEVDGKNYHVCNENKVSSFASGSTVKTIFNKIDDCVITGNICYMLYHNEGWVEVEKIKQ